MQQFTEDQQAAIDYRGKEVLVSAAAGSGKTSVLTQRIVGLVTDDAHPVDVDELLVVTFTEAAAGEMKERITKAITQLVSQDPRNKNLRRQLTLLKKASITTIHAFCRKVIKENFHLIDIDPNFRIADGTEIDILKEVVIKDIFEEQYKMGGVFFDLVEMYGDKYTDEKLRELVFEIYDFARKSTDPVGWLETQKATPGITKMEDTLLYKDLVAGHIKAVLEHVTFAIDVALELTALPEGPAKYAETLEKDKNYATRVEDAMGDLADLERVLSMKFDTMARISKKDEVDPELKDKVKGIRDEEIKKPLQTLYKDLPFGTDMAADLNQMHVYMSALMDLTLQFHERFSAQKKEKNMMYFDDLEHFAIAALGHESVRNSLMFKEVLIDEYQDSNDIQEFILSAVATSRFMVGDIKQSIYKFRGTGPELFNDKQKNGEVIALSKNFRSRLSIINGVNHFFGALIPSSGVAYDEAAKLHLGASYDPNPVTDQIEVHLIETKKDDEDDDNATTLQKEARVIAQRIKVLKAKWAHLNYSDIAIITRAKKGIVEVIIDELNEQGIPAQGESETGFFDTPEIGTLISLLHVIDNPLQDIPLAATLHSSIYDVDLDELLRLRNLDKTAHLYDNVETYLTEQDTEDTDDLAVKLKRLVADIEQFRKKARKMDIGHFVNHVIDETGYMYYTSAGKGGKLAADNLNLFLELAYKQGEMSFYAFIRYIEKIMNRKVEFGEAKTGTSQDTVKIMSIHKSKGLEFPLVFIMGLGKRLNKRDATKDILIDKVYGFGPRRIDLKNRMKYNTLAHVALKNKILKESIEEEVRVLYVAMTRAREKLVLVGSAAGIENKLKKWATSAEIKSPYFSGISLQKMSTFFDMIMPNVIEATDQAYDVVVHDEPVAVENDRTLLDIPPLETQLEALAEDAQAMSRLDAMFHYAYKHADLAGLPSSINISQIKGNYYKTLALERNQPLERPSKQVLLDMPEFTKEKDLNSLQIGTAVHTILEYLDIFKHDANNIEVFIAELIEKGILTELEKDSITKDMLLNYLDSELVSDMKQAKLIKKEVPFAMKISPEAAYLQPADGDLVVHGIIDCYYENDKGIILVDYKTDRLNKGNRTQAIRDRYGVQLAIYKNALEKITGKQVVASVIYLLSLGEAIYL